MSFVQSKLPIPFRILKKVDARDRLTPEAAGREFPHLPLACTRQRWVLLSSPILPKPPLQTVLLTMECPLLLINARTLVSGVPLLPHLPHPWPPPARTSAFAIPIRTSRRRGRARRKQRLSVGEQSDARPPMHEQTDLASFIVYTPPSLPRQGVPSRPPWKTVPNIHPLVPARPHARPRPPTKSREGDLLLTFLPTWLTAWLFRQKALRDLRWSRHPLPPPKQLTFYLEPPQPNPVSRKPLFYRARGELESRKPIILFALWWCRTTPIMVFSLLLLHRPLGLLTNLICSMLPVSMVVTLPLAIPTLPTWARMVLLSSMSTSPSRPLIRRWVTLRPPSKLQVLNECPSRSLEGRTTRWLICRSIPSVDIAILLRSMVLLRNRILFRLRSPPSPSSTPLSRRLTKETERWQLFVPTPGRVNPFRVLEAILAIKAELTAYNDIPVVTIVLREVLAMCFPTERSRVRAWSMERVSNSKKSPAPTTARTSSPSPDRDAKAISFVKGRRRSPHTSRPHPFCSLDESQERTKEQTLHTSAEIPITASLKRSLKATYNVAPVHSPTNCSPQARHTASPPSSHRR